MCIRKYPILEINLEGIFNNAKKTVEMCSKMNIEVCGVVKGTDSYENSYTNIANKMINAGCKSIGDSRLNTIKRMREFGMNSPILLLRIPMPCETYDVVKYADISLNSEIETIKALNIAAIEQNKIHKVILMMDLGDLREGYFDENEILEVSKYIEKNLKGIYLYGIGVNLGCFGAIKPDVKNLSRLVSIGEKISSSIGRKLDVISGGATTSLPLILNGTMPKGINHLRMGETIALATDMGVLWGLELEGFSTNNYVLKAQIIEVKEKPSYPIGEIFVDAFAKTPTYIDKGIRRRALAAVGKKDIGSVENLIPKLKGITVEGGSSDHLILDVTHCETELKVGDIVEFNMLYESMIYLTNSNSVTKKYV